MPNFEQRLEIHHRSVALREMKESFKRYPNHPCRRCNAKCCHDINFPISRIEVDRLANAISKLSKNKKNEIVNRARRCDSNENHSCPLLENSRCLVYEARPVICIRTGISADLPHSKDYLLTTGQEIPIKETVGGMCKACSNFLDQEGATIPIQTIRSERSFFDWAMPRFYATIPDAILIKYNGKSPLSHASIIQRLMKGVIYQD